MEDMLPQLSEYHVSKRVQLEAYV